MFDMESVIELSNATVELETAEGQFTWRVPACPLCGRGHIHGGGLVGEHDPRESLGSRTAHCRFPQKGSAYVLVDGNPNRTVNVMESASRDGLRRRKTAVTAYGARRNERRAMGANQISGDSNIRKYVGFSALTT
jgi:hypothetical protein